MEYSSNTVISYSGNSNISYDAPLFSNNDGSGNASGSNGSYIAGNASGKGMGAGKGGGGGRGAGKGRGKAMGGGQGKSMRQGCINIPDQFKEEQKNKTQSDEADSTINKTKQTDSDKTQKNPLDIMIKELEEKNRREQKKQHDKMLREKKEFIK